MVWPEPLSLSVTFIAQRLNIPSCIDMAMADPPDLRILRSVIVYARTALLPLVAEDLVSKLASSRDTLGIILIKYVHNRVCDGESFILEGRVSRESGDELAKCGKVPKKMPSGHMRHDEIG